MENQLKKVARLKKCPKGLESLLNSLWMVTPNSPLLPFDEALVLINSQFPDEVRFKREEKALEFCLAMLKEGGSLSEFPDYVWRPRETRHQDPAKAIQDSIERYEEFRIAREKVASLAKISQLPAERRQRMRNLLRFLNIEIDKNGEVHPREDWFTKAVTGVEAARIRECQICGRTFWAGRVQVQGCSSRCLDVLRKRNKRKRDAAIRIESNKRERGRPRLTETEKQDLVRRTLGSGGLSRSQIAHKTKLSDDDVSDVLRDLIMESDEVRFEQKDETRIYFLKETQTQTVKSQQAERKRR
jgi:predicted nucleic acid-binding Zn ribbon protein